MERPTFKIDYRLMLNLSVSVLLNILPWNDVLSLELRSHGRRPVKLLSLFQPNFDRPLIADAGVRGAN